MSRLRQISKAVPALIWSIQELLGDDFTVEVKEAWAEVYRLLASAMQSPPIAA